MDKRLLLGGLKASYCTLGCKLNFSETSTFEKTLKEMGVVSACEGEKADICIINTCSVTDVAAHKSRQMIRRFIRENDGAFVVVTGCHAQLAGEQIAKMKGVDLVIGSNEKALFGKLFLDTYNTYKKNRSNYAIASVDRSRDNATSGACHRVRTKDIVTFAPSCSRGNRTRYFLKVQDGCDYYCTYCTIPIARGRSRNATIAVLVDQARQAAAEGGREIVLTGVNIGDFGKTTRETFLELIRTLDTVEGIDRYRISSIEPDLLTDDIIDFCASSRAFMPHFHIPLQSGSDDVLRLMHRHYDTDLFARKIERIRTVMPEAFIGVDVMTGCRGETDALFERGYDFIRSLDVTKLHVFPYSERPGTAALRIPYIVSEGEKKERCRRLIALSDEKRRTFYAAHIGKRAEVLFEHSVTGGLMHGFTRNYVRVEVDADNSYDNSIHEVTLKEFNSDKSCLKADIIQS